MNFFLLHLLIYIQIYVMEKIFNFAVQHAVFPIFQSSFQTTYSFHLNPGKGKVSTGSLGLFYWYFRKCSEQLHDGKLQTVASDIIYVKPFICVVGK